MSPTFLSLNNLPEKKSSPTNRIRLAGVSNYKLAQLTFAPPDDRTLRKTALIKNLVEIVYNHTPNQHLTNCMVRWEYFTPESLENMTQRDVEKIIYRYSQVMYSTAITLGKENSKKEQQFLYSDYPEITAEIQELDEMSAYYASLFSGSVFSKDSLFQDEAGSSCSESDVDMEDADDKINLLEKPLLQPFQPNKLEILSTSQPTYLSQHPNSSNDKSTSRLSWLSDTGVPANSAAALNLASELITLFDMEFNVDLSVPSLHELKKLESSNGSTTSLHKVFSANEYQSSEEEDDEQEEEEEEEEEDVGHQVDPLQLTAERPRQQELPQQGAISKKKGFKLIPTLAQRSSRNSKSNSEESICPASSKIAPATPTHDCYKASLAPAHHSKYQHYYSSSSSSSDSEQEEEEEEESDNDTAAHKMPYRRFGISSSVKSITPPSRTSSLEYRASLQDRFRLSDEDSSDASSDYFNDSVDTFQVELNCSRDSAGVDSPSFKGFLNALSSIRKTRSRSSSITQDSDRSYPAISSTHQSIKKKGLDFDSEESRLCDDSKRRNSMQKVVKYLGGRSTAGGNKTTIRRGSVASSSLPVSATSTMMSGSSLFSETHHSTTTPSSPITLSPRVAKRHGVYTTSIISDTSSFNWAKETRRKDEFGSIHSKASSSKTMPAFFSNNNKQQQQGLARSSSTTSLGGFLKRLTGFNRKDKRQQRA